MSKPGIIRAIISVAIFTVIGLSSAQAGGFRAAYINSQYLLTLHPIYAQLLTLQEQARADVSDLNQRVQELLTKRQSGTELTPDESDILNATLVTLQSVTARYEAEIQALLEPAFEEITSVIADTAKELGITMVFDYSAAREAGLIAYADPDTDITDEVAARLTGRE